MWSIVPENFSLPGSRQILFILSNRCPPASTYLHLENEWQGPTESDPRAWSNFLVHLAGEAGIPYQVVVKKVGGTNAVALQVEGTGAKAAALSVPVRYIHAPVSLLRKSDLEAAIALVARLLREVRRFEPDLF
jgi:hypothetical protein